MSLFDIGGDEIFCLSWYFSFKVVFWEKVDWNGGGEKVFVGRFNFFCIY